MNASKVIILSLAGSSIIGCSSAPAWLRSLARISEEEAATGMCDNYVDAGNRFVDEGCESSAEGYAWGTTLNECKQICDGASDCKSFAFNEVQQACWTKTKCGSPSEPVKHFFDWSTYYKPEPCCSVSPCGDYVDAGNLFVDEGSDSSAGGYALGITLCECKRICDGASDCNSFAFNEAQQACWTKTKCGSPSEPVRYFNDWRTYYKPESCCKEIGVIDSQ